MMPESATTLNRALFPAVRLGIIVCPTRTPDRSGHASYRTVNEMNSTRLICSLLVLLLTSDAGRAQDDDQDAAREVEVELAESERELKLAREHVAFLGQRIERLRKLRTVRMSVRRTELAI